MTNGSDRLDRIERTLEEIVKIQRETATRQQEMAARQQYHDEALERQDADIKRILEAINIDAENIRALARIAEAHERRLDRLDGEEPS
jgi:hypothetical protein